MAAAVYNIPVEFPDFLRTCTKEDGNPLSERSIEHYNSGLLVASDDMLREGMITKPLTDMDLFEPDIAIAVIRKDSFFEAKDKKGKRMYSNALKHYCLYVFSLIGDKDVAKKEEEKVILDPKLKTTEREAIVKARVGGRASIVTGSLRNTTGSASSLELISLRFSWRATSNHGPFRTTMRGSARTTDSF